MPKTIALVGNPNCGKTTLFNQLTGSSAHVGNWPGVTVDRKEGRYRHQEHDFIIVDLPGVYSLSPYTPEELIARDYIMNGGPDVIVNIIDTTNLERSLYLTTQLLEMGRPMVLALNMIDLVRKAGFELDMQMLSAKLALPVVPVSALHGEAMHELMHAAEIASAQETQERSVLMDTPLKETIQFAWDTLRRGHAPFALYHGIKVMENDPQEMKEMGHVGQSLKAEIVRRLSAIGVSDPEAEVADLRYRYITRELSPLMRHTGPHAQETASDRVDRLLTHKLLGIPIFFAIMFMVFQVTFGETLLGIPFIPGPGVAMQQWVEVLVTWLSGAVEGLLAAAGASDWLLSLVAGGIFGGLGAVMSFLPQILLLFFFISLLEDSGYMARVAFIMDRPLRKFGLSGRAFIPMLMGFGCSVPAIMATRTLEGEQDRRLTTLLIPYMSCGAKLPIYALFGAALFPGSSGGMVFGVYMIGVIVALISGVVLKNTALKQEERPFLMELPTYHMPGAKSLGLHLWEKLKGFLVRAGTVLLLVTIVIWFLSNFSLGLKMVGSDIGESILGKLGNLLRPVFTPLGFAGGAEGWKPVVAILSGQVAKEMVVTTLGMLYDAGLGEAGGGAALVASISGAFTPLSALSFMVFNLLTIPCVAAVSAMMGELREFRKVAFNLCAWLGTAWVIAFIVYHIGQAFGFA